MKKSFLPAWRSVEFHQTEVDWLEEADSSQRDNILDRQTGVLVRENGNMQEIEEDGG